MGKKKVKILLTLAAYYGGAFGPQSPRAALAAVRGVLNTGAVHAQFEDDVGVGDITARLAPVKQRGR